MQRDPEKGNGEKQGDHRRLRSRARLLPLVAAKLVMVAALGGCAGGAGKTEANDPLVGPDVPRPAVPAAAPSVAPQARAAVPALPPATSADSVAALAGGDTVPGGRALAITDPQVNLAKNTWKGPGTPEGPSAGGAILKKPELLPGETTSPVNLQGPFVDGNAGSGQGGGPSSLKQLLDQLKARGMTAYWLQDHPQGNKFTCTVRQAHSTKIRQLEAIAGSPEEAARAVLDKLEPSSAVNPPP